MCRCCPSPAPCADFTLSSLHRVWLGRGEERSEGQEELSPASLTAAHSVSVSPENKLETNMEPRWSPFEWIGEQGRMGDGVEQGEEEHKTTGKL